MIGILQKISDEGTSEPFVARLYAGILELREHVLQSIIHNQEEYEFARSDFDKVYTPILDAMSACRSANKNIQSLIAKHRDGVESGQILKYQRQAIEIGTGIDKDLKEGVSQFLVNGSIAIKGIQNVLKKFDIDIGFLFQKKSSFQKKLGHFKSEGNLLLSEYLEKVRNSWSETFIFRRNSLEHDGWYLPHVRYQLENSNVKVIEPIIDSLRVSQYLAYHTNRIISFVENMVVYGFKSALFAPFTIIEIPREQRPSEFPKRFEWWIIGDPNKTEWILNYSEDDFP